MFSYHDACEYLLQEFPELSDHADLDMDLPYITYAIVFVPFIRECFHRSQPDTIKRIFSFLEEMANSEQPVQNLLQAGILEAFWEDPQLYADACAEMLEKTKSINDSISSYLEHPTEKTE